MDLQDLHQILTEFRKDSGGIRVSLHLPTQRTGSSRIGDRVTLDMMIEQTEAALNQDYSEDLAGPLCQGLRELASEVDFNHNGSGLGLFVSRTHRQLLKFPIDVQQRLLISDHYDIRSLLQWATLAQPYVLLQLSEKWLRLYLGSLDHLEELHEDAFPRQYRESYEYANPVRASSYTGSAAVQSLEGDKTRLEHIRMEQFFRAADQVLQPILERDLPLLVAGDSRQISWFREHSTSAHRIIGSFHGNFEHSTLQHLGGIAWRILHEYQKMQQLQRVREFIEKAGSPQAIMGYAEIWKALSEGRGRLLLAETDQHLRGYIGQEADRLFLEPPSFPFQVLPDLLNELLWKTLDQDAQISLLDPGMLLPYKGTVLLTRY